MTDGKAYYVVLNNPLPGQDEQLTEWTEKVHIPEVLSVEGFVSAQRFKLADAQRTAEPAPYQYLIVYTVEGDLATALTSLGAASASFDKSVTSAPDRLAYAYVPCGPAHSSARI